MTLEPPHFKISRSELPQLLFRMENKHRPGGNPYTVENPIRKSYRFSVLHLSPYRNSLWSHLQALLCTGLSRVRLFTTPRPAAHQAPLSMGLPKQEHWSRSPLPSPGSSPPRDRTCISWGSRMAGRFFTTEPLEQSLRLYFSTKQVMLRLAYFCAMKPTLTKRSNEN